MAKFELYFPAKPFIVTQGWGIYNPAYLQFGFDHHNGVDFLLGNDKKLHAPCDFFAVDVGENSGAGKYIRWITTEKFDVLGTNCKVGGMFMHMESHAIATGATVKEGDLLGVADNTGFSTGPHTHLSVYRLGDNGERLDTNASHNNTFDPRPFFNNFYATDAQKVEGILQSVISLLVNFIKK
jgi:murein DD-endopeptidase MepM/ murein hydrolase activator NlpD